MLLQCFAYDLIFIYLVCSTYGLYSVRTKYLGTCLACPILTLTTGINHGNKRLVDNFNLNPDTNANPIPRSGAG